MLPATPPAIHYSVDVLCGGQSCPLPIRAVTPSFTTIYLRIEPEPMVMPHVTWRSRNPAVVYPTFTSPLETTLTLPGDTAATPAPNYLRTMLVPAGTGPQRLGDARGATVIEAEIGAPVNERIEIPVYSTGSGADTAPPADALRKLVATQLAPAQTSPALTARIDYASRVTSTYGEPSTIFTEMPWPKGTGGFFQSFNSVRVAVSPEPMHPPTDVQWSIDGDSATVTSQGWLQGTHPGKATIHARIGAPFNQILSLPLVTYPTLVLPCNNGVIFQEDGSLAFTTDEHSSDLFSTCTELKIPGGGVVVSNGNDPERPVAHGTIRGPQFPELNRGLWEHALTELDGAAYNAAIEPCSIPESANASRIDWSCKTMPARTLLFRTRSGHYVKWLMQIGNGFNILAGPYAVL